jgi:glycosyltransferase 2 family protein
MRDLSTSLVEHWKAWSERLRLSSKARAMLRAAFAIVAFFAIAYAIYRSRQSLESVWARINFAYLAAAVCIWASLHFLSPLVAIVVLRRVRHLSYRRAFQIHALRLPAKYLPGGIWHMVGRFADFREVGYPASVLAQFFLIENLTAATVTLGIGSALISLETGHEFARLGSWVAVLCLAIYAAVPWVVRVLTRTSVSITWSDYARITAFVLLFWAGASVSFVLFFRGLSEPTLAHSPLQLAGSYLFSWGAGFIAVFAPQGMGVFEYVAGILLGAEHNVLLLVSIMALFRVVVLAADLLVWSFACLLSTRSRQ